MSGSASFHSPRKSWSVTGKNIGRAIFWPAFVLAAAGCIGWSYCVRLSAEQKMPVEVAAARAEAERIQREVVLFTKRVVPPRLAFAALLQKSGIAPPTAARLTAAAQPVFDLRHVRAGNALTIGRSVLGELREIRYDIDADHVLSIAPTDRKLRRRRLSLRDRENSVADRHRRRGRTNRRLALPGRHRRRRKARTRHAPRRHFRLRPRLLHRPAPRRHVPHRHGKDDARERRDRRLRPHPRSPSTSTPAAPIAPSSSTILTATPPTTRRTANR